jgi:hypothetical protein
MSVNIALLLVTGRVFATAYVKCIIFCDPNIFVVTSMLKNKTINLWTVGPHRRRYSVRLFKREFSGLVFVVVDSVHRTQ